MTNSKHIAGLVGPTLIAIPWGITAPVSMLLLAILFEKDSEVITQTNEI
ncbi:hypothetical protein [Chamaesiphon sp.]